MRRLDDFERKGWHNVCEIRSGPEVQYVGLVNREDDADDRVVVRITAVLRDVVVDAAGNVLKRNEEDDETTTLAEYWTLGRAGERWLLLSIEQDSEGAHHLDAPIVASPWSDEARLHDAAVTELAVADAVPGTRRSASSSTSTTRATARVQAMDLSVVDGRFAPRCWRRRRGGRSRRGPRQSTARTRRSSAPPRPRPRTRCSTPTARARASSCAGRGSQALRIAALDAHAQPPTMAVEAELRGRRYLEDRDTAAVLEGSKDRETAFTERWTLALGADPATPWRIVATAAVG